MGDCTDNTKPIAGASRQVTLTETPLTVAALLAAASPVGSVIGSAVRITLAFNLPTTGQAAILARISRDGAFTLTATQGERILAGQKVALTLEQFPAEMRSVVGTVEAYLEQFELEV